MDAVACAFLPGPFSLRGFPLPLVSLAPSWTSCWTETPFQNGFLCTRYDESSNASGCSPEIPTTESVCRISRLAPPPLACKFAQGSRQGREHADPCPVIRRIRGAFHAPNAGPIADKPAVLSGDIPFKGVTPCSTAHGPGTAGAELPRTATLARERCSNPNRLGSVQSRRASFDGAPDANRPPGRASGSNSRSARRYQPSF
jgi:hypothetical protein